MRYKWLASLTLVSLNVFFARLTSQINVPLKHEFVVINQVKFSNVDKVYETKILFKECRCKQMCLADDRCMSYSWTQQEVHGICKLSEEIIDYDNWDFKIQSSSNGKVCYKEARGFFAGPDDRVYFYHENHINFDAALEICDAKSGFQVGIYKTSKEHKALMITYFRYRTEIWVNMRSVSDEPHAKWEDGTWFNETEVSQKEEVSFSANDYDKADGVMFRYKHNIHLDHFRTQKFTVLCQSVKKIPTS